ncbi:anthranilate phosphoribosyltransferase [Desulfospira joergensenii]|uniref:anthranilate phosphoribosyltransferase n=1 Tax=Desulfospira joergensenii TaxID=53329 RepID=UPI0003B63D3B|nr:anthranilate phosphoribosyltransferase [Desulfospira joergensenii]
MSVQGNKAFGAIITRLINKENMTREETRQTFITVLDNQTTEMQQGAFLSALTAKGETPEEVAGAWEAIYDLDTAKVNIKADLDLVENSGTGMDTFKTYNISTAASLIAAAGGIPMARHGARAITSVCGTVDMAEALGVDVECTADLVAKSIESAGIGLFNGMSPHVHPNALGRILSQIHFGSTLNIAASLANPALPSIGVRGVYAREMIRPVAQVMKTIGYKNGLVLYGAINGSDRGMDEASVCGPTFCARIDGNKEIEEFTLDPKALGLEVRECKDLVPEPEIGPEARRFAALMANRDPGARKDAALLNAGLIYYAAGKASGVEEGIEQAARALEKGKAFETLENWVSAQNTEPEKGLATLHRLI